MKDTFIIYIKNPPYTTSNLTGKKGKKMINI